MEDLMGVTSTLDALYFAIETRDEMTELARQQSQQIKILIYGMHNIHGMKKSEIANRLGVTSGWISEMYNQGKRIVE